MKTKRVRICMNLIVLVLTTTSLYAQDTYTIESKPVLTISGTSTLHDWDMTSNTATGKLTATDKAGKLEKITALTVEMPAESLKSGKKGLDKNAYKALKTTEHKTVKFELKQANKTSNGTWNLKGNFTIAGVTKEVTIVVKEISTGGKYTLSGDYNFKLTEYKVVPPTVMMGTVKTGDAVKISFAISFK